MTNHTLEKPNDWWWLHLPLVISLNLAQNPGITPKVDYLPLLREREREREHSKSHTNHATHHTCAHYAIPFLRRAFNKPRTRAGELPRRVVERRPHDDGGFPPWSRPNIDSYDSQTWLECYCHHWYWCYQPYHQWYVDKTLKWHFLLTNFFLLII